MMAKSKSSGSRSGKGSVSVEKLAKVAMSREMLAAGLAAAAAAISASPAARRKIRDAGLDAADTASSATSSVAATATRLATLIAEAVSDAAQRLMSGNWGDPDGDERAAAAKPRTSRPSPAKRTAGSASGKKAAKRTAGSASGKKPAKRAETKGAGAKRASTRRPATTRTPPGPPAAPGDGGQTA